MQAWYRTAQTTCLARHTTSYCLCCACRLPRGLLLPPAGRTTWRRRSTCVRHMPQFKAYHHVGLARQSPCQATGMRPARAGQAWRGSLRAYSQMRRTCCSRSAQQWALLMNLAQKRSLWYVPMASASITQTTCCSTACCTERAASQHTAACAGRCGRWVQRQANQHSQ